MFSSSAFLFSFCSKQSSEDSRNAIAAVNGKYLLPDDLKNIVPIDLSSKDSAALIENYIQKWIEEELVLNYALNNLPSVSFEIDKQVEEYRRNLIIHSYQQQLIRQKLDTSVSQLEVEEYYTKNISSFILKDNIVKCVYVKLNKKTPGIEKVRKLYSADAVKDRDQLRNFCIQFAENYFLDDGTWLLFDDILKEVPISNFNPENFLKQNKNIELEDDKYVYFLSVKKAMIKNNISPLAFERDNIRKLIINKRKLALIEEMRRSVYDKAKEKNEFTIYR